MYVLTPYCYSQGDPETEHGLSSKGRAKKKSNDKYLVYSPDDDISSDENDSSDESYDGSDEPLDEDDQSKIT